MNVLDQAIAHFEPQLTNPKEIIIKEWETDGNDGIFYATALNLYERKKIEKITKGDQHEMAVEVIILKLQGADGTRVFSAADKPKLMRKVSPQVIARVAGDIIGDPDDEEEIEKN